MEKDIKSDDKPSLTLFGTLGRIAVIFFAGVTFFMFVAAIMLIFLTKPASELIVPDVTGKKFVSVYSILSRKGMIPKIEFRNTFDIDDGIILRQSPEKGSVVKENSTLNLVISRSSLEVEVPDLSGIELHRSINKLKSLHVKGRTVSLDTGIVSYMPSEKYSENRVIDQQPAAGQRIHPDRKINLLVSSGKIKAGNRMPGVRGQSIDLCFDVLMSRQVNIYEEIVKTGNIKNSGLVISQKPYRGEKLSKGAFVKLKVYWYPLKEHPYMAYEKIEYRIPDDMVPGQYEVLIDDDSAKRVRFSRRMKPGQTIRCIFHRKGNAKINIMRDKKIIRIMGVKVDE